MGTGGVTVNAGDHSLPYISTNVNNPIQGMLRINNTNIEVFNNTGWQTLSTSYATVSLDGNVQDLIQWATKKQLEETRIEELCSKYPGLGKARDNFELFKAFVAAEESKL